MFNASPNALIPGFAVNSTKIEAPIASFPELTAQEADGTTGDSRKVVYALMEKLYSALAALPEADRPTKLRIDKSQSLQPGNIIAVQYTVQLSLSTGQVDVAAE